MFWLYFVLWRIWNWLLVLRYQCTPKLTILPNFSYWYSQVHLIEFFQLQKVLRKKVSPRQSYKGKTILWINYLYLEAVNKLSWSIKVPLKVTWRSQTFRLSQNAHGKTIRVLTVKFTLVLYSQRNAFIFSKQFWVAAAPFERSLPSMLPVFTKYIPAFYGDMSL